MAFDHFIIKWDPSKCQVEITSGQIVPANKFANLDKKIEAEAKAAEQKVQRAKAAASEKIDWKPPVEWMKAYRVSKIDQKDMPVEQFKGFF